jgi:4'-phosphopantetheinyl transferase
MHESDKRDSVAVDWYEWPIQTSNQTIGQNDVEVWCASLDAPDEAGRAERWLSPDERQRAARFRFDQDRQRFILHRGILRALLGRYLAVHPRELAFMSGPNGKPALASPFAARGLRFNLSHSQNLALYAFALDREVGVDVEAIRPLDDVEGIARRYFSRAENAALERIVPVQRSEAFFNCWTRKEAFLKATGEGLDRPLDSFDVSLAPGEPARLLATGEPTGAWSLHDLAPAPGFRAAVAAAGEDWTIHCWRWTWSPAGQTFSTSGNI